MNANPRHAPSNRDQARFGHGARFREYGSWNNSYHISLAPPYGDGGGWAGNGSFSKRISDYEQIMITVAGNEANTILSHSLRLKWIERGKINYRETVFYSFTAQDIAGYILLTRACNRNYGDIAEYLDQINTLYTRTGAALSTDDLVWCSLVNLLDPFQYFAIAAYFYNYLYQGEEEFAIPIFDLWGIRYLPAFHSNLAP